MTTEAQVDKLAEDIKELQDKLKAKEDEWDSLQTSEYDTARNALIEAYNNYVEQAEKHYSSMSIFPLNVCVSKWGF
jgi:chromosome segregation ATPase